MKTKSNKMKTLFYWAALLALCASCAGPYSAIIKDTSLCDYDFSITEEDKTFDTLTYKLGKKYDVGNDTIFIYDLWGTGYAKTIYNKESRIEKVIGFTSKGNIESATFYIGSSSIGKGYSYDETGNIKDVYDNDEGYTICWAQAIAIAKARARYDQCKHKHLRTDKRMEKRGGKERKVWQIYLSFAEYNDECRIVEIDGKTGKIWGVYTYEISLDGDTCERS